MQEISELMGTKLLRPTKGSTIPNLFFSDLAAQMGIPQQGSMPAMARAIIESAHLPWSTEFSSEHTVSGGGSTVTALGLLQVKNAVLIWLGKKPEFIIDEVAEIEWEPAPNWLEIRSELPLNAKEGFERPGASAFRDLVLEEYDYMCAVTRCETESVIEVAHIVPYFGVASDHIQNALPLRSDIHRLFDKGLLLVNFDTSNNLFISLVHPTVMHDYSEFDHLTIALPESSSSYPSKVALEIKSELSKSIWENSITTE